MKRFVKTATVAAAGCAMVLGGASIATADPHGHGHGRHGHGHGYGHGYGHGFGHGGYGRGGFGRGGHGHGHGASARGFAAGSPGVFSGNVVQVPINIPINVCGNSVDIFFGILNPTFGNICINR
ncbi:chaplin [Streptomyces piniterrae]|uniref:Chaplin n=1 Tax=Streptomyces piniterrae TaxID=2571125 RepID=A0A4U0NN62_9ACTN|nr:chaplin [Streptomyces piniterrae]TJZ55941.1 chaplin [Streptomyces piniterrae]